jgi:SPX domain protein involved in polyphosphate accumulation
MIMEVRPAFPALSALGLSGEQFAALAEQGAVYAEDRGQGQVFCRLRFRLHRRQHTRYIGNNEGFIDQVRKELAQLQAKTQSRRELRRLTKKARHIARSIKHSLEPLLPSVGRVFHGRAIRRPRANRSDGSVSVQ